MICDIPELLSDLVPRITDQGPFSTASIRTTNYQLLVFGTDHEKPVCAVKRLSEAEVASGKDILTELHSRVPQIVPECLAAGPWRPGCAVLITSGLPGLPWFRLIDKHLHRDQCLQLRSRARETLVQMHHAIRDVPKWVSVISPGRELAIQIDSMVNKEVEFSKPEIEHMRKIQRKLERLGKVESCYQHGDFCLNNLMISRDSIGVIDYEEFGLTSMPFHDMFGLALSVNQFVEHRITDWCSIGEDIEYCLRPFSSKSEKLQEHMDGFFLHHLLWRISHNHGSSLRERMTRSLIELTKDFLASPSKFVPEVVPEGVSKGVPGARPRKRAVASA